MVCPIIDTCDSYVDLIHFKKLCESKTLYKSCPHYNKQLSDVHTPKFWRATLEALKTSQATQ
jgi:hypothetical protein